MSSSSEGSRWLPILPALTLLVVIAVFSLNALALSGSAGKSHAQAHGAHASGQSSTGELPVLGQVSDFQLTERSGQAVSLQTLAGRIWVADFIFTSCQAECPLMNLEMQKIQRHFATESRLQLVSFSVDPETDTPERLREYAVALAKPAESWWFLTGDRPQLYQLANESFKLAAQDLGQHAEHTEDKSSASEDHTSHGANGSTPFLHSQKFVLVDGQGRIRAYYDSTDPQAIQQLIATDVPRLLEEG
ncbi:MAG: SCO family protein [Candidatus Sericytochromatia bacterium]